jgi:choline dehydrogenase
MRPTEEFDYVIVGAGSSGCVLADRLTEDGRNSVLLLEYGGSDRSIFVQMPSALSIPMNSEKYDWRFYSEPEPGLGGRQLHTPRGKVLGGSSSINGLVYVRGNAQDFERWESEGATGWNYASVLPYFRRAEKRAAGGDDYRGNDGPLQTRYGTLENPLHSVWLEAGRQAGYASTGDINGYQQEGFGRLDMTVSEDGHRCSAANAYLRPAMKRPNLAVKTGALAMRILFDGRRAIGVEYRQGDATCIARARREVIVSAGPINSPKLLKLSGVGSAAELREHGIEVVADRPGVGENLQDHIEFYFQVACTQPCHAVFVDGPLRARDDRRALAAAPRRPRRDQSLRDRRVHPQPRGRARIPTSSSTSCRSPSLTTAPRSRRSTGSRRTSGRCARRAVAS